jgi:hypothetical protein
VVAGPCFAIVSELSGDTRHRELSDSRRNYHPIGPAVECDGLEGYQRTRTIGSASHHAVALPGKARDLLQDQVLTVAARLGLQSKGHPFGFKQLSYR